MRNILFKKKKKSSERDHLEISEILSYLIHIKYLSDYFLNSSEGCESV